MEEQQLGDCMRLILIDGLTANNVEKLNLKIDELFKSEIAFAEIVLDLGNIKNIDSVGVTFVISLYRRTEGIHKKFSISGASEDILSLFKLMKLDQFFDMND
jgi:anti-anti-sigma factor